MSITMRDVESTAIEAVAFDDRTQSTWIKFHATGWYVYPGSSREEFEALSTAESVGAYFNEYIRPRSEAYKHGWDPIEELPVLTQEEAHAMWRRDKERGPGIYALINMIDYGLTWAKDGSARP